MPKMDGMTLYLKIKEIKTSIIEDLKNKIDLLLSLKEVNNKPTTMIL
jgi:hypothetical protein